MIVILHNFRGSKYLINTNNINSVEIRPVNPETYAKEIAEAGGGPLSFIYIDWQFNASTSILVSSETAEEFLNLFEDAVEIF